MDGIDPNEVLCPRSPDRWTGCNAYGCPICGHKKTFRVARAISLQQPRGFLTITGLKGSFTTIRNQVKSLFKWCRRHGERPEAAWVVEPNPSPSEVAEAHIHGYLLEDHDPEVLATAASRAGMGIIHLSQPQPQFLLGAEGVAAATRAMYLFKWAKEPVGSPEAAEGLAHHLELNGGWLLHNTRGFFGEQTREQALWHQPVCGISDSSEFTSPWIDRRAA